MEGGQTPVSHVVVVSDHWADELFTAAEELQARRRGGGGGGGGGRKKYRKTPLGLSQRVQTVSESRRRDETQGEEDGYNYEMNGRVYGWGKGMRHPVRVAPSACFVPLETVQVGGRRRGRRRRGGEGRNDVVERRRARIAAIHAKRMVELERELEGADTRRKLRAAGKAPPLDRYHLYKTAASGLMPVGEYLEEDHYTRMRRRHVILAARTRAFHSGRFRAVLEKHGLDRVPTPPASLRPRPPPSFGSSGRRGVVTRKGVARGVGGRRKVVLPKHSLTPPRWE